MAALLVLLAACNSDPKAAATRYVASGNRYFSRGQYREASILYRRAIAKDQRSPDAWYRLGLVNAKLGELPEARRDFSRAMELNPDNTDAIVQLGDLDLAFYLLDPPSGRAYMADLKELTDRLLKGDARSFDGLRFSGNIALARNDTASAIRKFQEANLVKPDQPGLTLTLIQTLFAARRNEEAEALANGAIDRNKTFAPVALTPIYDALYVHYMRSRRSDLAEQVLLRRSANNSAETEALVKLAFHYFMTRRPGDMQAVIAHLTSNPKVFPDGRLAAGDVFVRIHDYASALEQYEAGERSNRKKSRLYRKKIAEVLATQGQRDSAAKVVAGLLKEDPKDPDALALHATLLLEDSRQLKAAIGELEPLIAKMPRNATLHFNLGQAFALEHNPNKAREQFETALRLDPHHAPAKLAWAALALERGEAARAAEAGAEVLSEDSTNVRARLIRASALVRMAEPVKARQELEMALNLDPSSNDGRWQLAELDFIEARYQEAEGGYRALSQAGDPRGVEGVLKTKIVQGDVQGAVQFAADQVKRWPQRTGVRLAFAKTLLAAHAFREAAAQFQVLIDQDRTSSELYLQLGEAKLAANDIPGAAAAFQTARQFAARDARPVLELALLYDRTGRAPEARKEYETVIQLQPDNPTALNNLAYLEAEQSVDLDQALAHAERARQKLPADPDVQDTLALIYLRKNLTNDGIRLLRELVSRKPASAPFRLHLALALYQKGDRASAKHELEAALSRQPSPGEQQQIRELLRKVG